MRKKNAMMTKTMRRPLDPPLERGCPLSPKISTPLDLTHADSVSDARDNDRCARIRSLLDDLSDPI
jgi:hypothetical protein